MKQLCSRKPIQRKSVYYVYMVKCTTGAYYTGYTGNLENRIKLHNSGRGAKYLRGKGPVELVYTKKFKYYKTALNMERKIKTFPRSKKERLIEEQK